MTRTLTAYFLACLVAALGIHHGRTRFHRVAWGRLAAWWCLTALASLMIWSLLGCTLYMYLRERVAPESFSMTAACFVGAGYWAAYVVVVALPFYGLALTWYALHSDPEATELRGTLARLALLSLPPSLVLFLGFTLPFEDMAASFREGLPPAVLALVTTFLALLLPRLGIPSLHWGRLLHKNGA